MSVNANAKLLHERVMAGLTWARERGMPAEQLEALSFTSGYGVGAFIKDEKPDPYPSDPMAQRMREFFKGADDYGKR